MAGPWITEHEERIVLDALRSGWYGKDAYRYVETFQAEFAKYHDRKYALMTPNCATALHLLLAGLDIGSDDDVIVPECTWVGSLACVTYQRARTVFADTHPDHSCLTPESIEHDCVLADGVEIGPGATLCGRVEVGENSWICAGATILPRIRIGRDAIVGAGAVVREDVPDRTTVVGVPAHPIRGAR